MFSVREFVAAAFIGGDEYVRYRSLVQLQSRLVRPLVAKALRRSGLSSFNAVDLGCGFSQHFPTSRLQSYLGIDISLRLLLRHPLRRRPRTAFVVADLDVPAVRPTDNFNAVLGTLVLNYLAYPSLALERLRAPGIFFCFVCPNPAFDARHGAIRGNIVVLPFMGFQFTYYHYSIKDLDSAIGPYSWREMLASDPIEPDGLPPYICLLGEW